MDRLQSPADPPPAALAGSEVDEFPDEFSRLEHPCPCDESSILEVHTSDDWGRSDTHWRMLCARCRDDYMLHRWWEADKKGFSIQRAVWLTRDQQADLERAIEASRVADEAVLRYARTRYLRSWMRLTETAKSKKELWALLTDEGANYPSLSTFYEHIRRSGLRPYWKQRFTVDSMPHIISVLSIEDPELQNLLAMAERRRAAAHDQELELRCTGFHGSGPAHSTSSMRQL